VAASASGVFNCVTYWYELDVGPSGVTGADGPPLDLGPRRAPTAEMGSPLPFERRARRQRLHYVGYERAVAEGEAVSLVARHDATSLSVEAPADAAAEAAGTLLRWPSVNLLAYHFPMIADEGRNGCFDRALRSAVARFASDHGRPPRVLDIGSGSGLLAMMAARAGAAEVVSLEMVPQLAAAARHIVAANGYADRVSVRGVMSTDLDPASVGGRFDVLVCEIVDDGLLGEGARCPRPAPQPSSPQRPSPSLWP